LRFKPLTRRRSTRSNRFERSNVAPPFSSDATFRRIIPQNAGPRKTFFAASDGCRRARRRRDLRRAVYFTTFLKIAFQPPSRAIFTVAKSPFLNVCVVIEIAFAS